MIETKDVAAGRERPRVRDPRPGTTIALLTLRARMFGDGQREPYRTLLEELRDYEPSGSADDRRGAEFRTLTAVICEVGLSGPANVGARDRWYQIAKSIPLTEAMAAHILYTLRPDLRSRSAGVTM